MPESLNELKIYLLHIESDFASQLRKELVLCDESINKLAKRTAPLPVKQFLSSRALINHILKVDWQSSSINYLLEDSKSPPIIKPSGKLFLSISHSGDYVAVAIVDNPVGNDVETVLRDRDYLARDKKNFHPNEVMALESSGSPKQLEANFYRLWTLRECLFKLGGLASLTDQGFELERKIVEGGFNPYSYSNNKVYLSATTGHPGVIKLIFIER